MPLSERVKPIDLARLFPPDKLLTFREISYGYIVYQTDWDPDVCRIKFLVHPAANLELSCTIKDIIAAIDPSGQFIIQLI